MLLSKKMQILKKNHLFAAGEETTSKLCYQEIVSNVTYLNLYNYIKLKAYKLGGN